MEIAYTIISETSKLFEFCLRESSRALAQIIYRKPDTSQWRHIRFYDVIINPLEPQGSSKCMIFLFTQNISWALEQWFLTFSEAPNPNKNLRTLAEPLKFDQKFHF